MRVHAQAMPTDAELEAEGWEDAGDFLLRLRSQGPQEYANWASKRAASWNDVAPRQPPHRSLSHLMSLLLRSVVELVAVKPPRKGEPIVIPAEPHAQA